MNILSCLLSNFVKRSIDRFFVESYLWLRLGNFYLLGCWMLTLKLQHKR